MIDAVASWSHLVDHLAPIWLALPVEARGTFWCSSRTLTKHAATRGVNAAVGLPHHAGPLTLVANHHDLTQTHQARPVAYLEHGAGQTYTLEAAHHPSYSGGTDRQRVSLFLTLNETTAARERVQYPDAHVVVVGSPHLDRLAAVRAEGAREHAEPPLRVAFAFHWDCHLVAETRETFTWWRPAIRALAQSGRWRVAGHAHPRLTGVMERQLEKWRVPFVRDLDDVVRHVDVAAVDNSSAMFELAALGIPVVALNHPRYRRDVHHGLRFWESIPGPQVDAHDELEARLRDAFDPMWVVQRRAIADQVYPPETRGHAARLAADAVLALHDRTPVRSL